MDGRKKNGGHSTKPKRVNDRRLLAKSEALGLIEQMDDRLPSDKVLDKLASLVNEGDFQAIKLWLSYRFGQPKQNIDHTTQGEKINQPQITVLSKASEDELKKLYEGHSGPDSQSV